jgi:hypothetical protein
MRTNNFKRLMEEEERTAPPPPNLKSDLDRTMGLVRFVGEVVDLYLPRLVDMLVSMVGGSPASGPGRQDPASYVPTSNKNENRTIEPDEPANPGRGE